MKKRNALLSVVLLVIVLTSILAGCAEKTDSPEFSGAKDAFLEQWFGLLQANEQIYSGIFHTLESTADFSQNGNWENLLKARAAASAALVEIRRMELPAMELTQEQIRLLVDGGVEVNAAQREFEALEGVRSDRDATALLLVSTLENDVFLTASTQEAIPAMTEFYQAYLALECRYLCQFTNYLLLQTDSADLWSGWQEQLPCMAACADVWYDDTDDVQNATDQLLDEMEALQSSMGSFLGVSEYTLEIVQEAVDSGDPETLRREVNEIPGVPGYFPVPPMAERCSASVYGDGSGFSGKASGSGRGEAAERTLCLLYFLRRDHAGGCAGL